MVIEVIYTHDTSSPPKWLGRTVHPALTPVTAEGRDLDQCRRRMAEGIEASGIKAFDLIEWQGVRLPPAETP